MSKVWKEDLHSREVQAYDFLSGFKAEPPKEITPETLDALEAEQRRGMSRNEILAQAEEEARAILGDAREQAEILREEAFAEGKKEGAEQGFQEAYNEQREFLQQESREFQKNLEAVLESVSIEKDKILEKYVDDLKRVTLAVAEKVIQTSIQSSGDIIKRMILAATDKMKKKQWAKIYVSKCNTGVSMEVDTEFLENLSALSDNIKIITMDNGEDGTCIIELPDEIVDASVSTQIENIKDILNNARV